MAAKYSGRKNFITIGIAVVEVLSGILRDLLAGNVPSITIAKKVKKSSTLPKLRTDQVLLVENASTAGYTEFDITLLYTLLRNECPNIPPPTNGWGKEPGPTDITVGDDIERIRFIRNKVLGHISTTSVPDSDFISIWVEMEAICQRMEIHLGSTNNYVQNLQHLETQSVDEELEKKYVEKLQEMVEKEKDLKEMIQILSSDMKDLRDKMTDSGRQRPVSFENEDISVDDLTSILMKHVITPKTTEKESYEESQDNIPVPFADLSFIQRDMINSSLYLQEKFETKDGDLKKTPLLKKDMTEIGNAQATTNLNNCIIIKAVSLKDISVKDLALTLVREKMAKSNEYFHEHCNSCHDVHCKKINDCPIIKCRNNCGDVFFHQCKQEEHNELCRRTTISCINIQYGCQMQMPRFLLAYHLKECGIMTDQTKATRIEPCCKQVPEKVKQEDYSTPKKDELHDHCTKCISAYCKMTSCPVLKCTNRNCEMKLHKCKMSDHQNVCLFSEIYCINRQYGCTYYMTKLLLKEHLQRCTAINFDFLYSPQFNYLCNSTNNHHCDTCYDTECTTNVGDECKLVKCNLCHRNLHNCKVTDHMTICSVGLTECINAQYRCQMKLTRCAMTTHLLHCPLMNWPRRHCHNEIKEDAEPDGDDDHQSNDDISNRRQESDERKKKDEHVYDKLPKRNVEKNLKWNCSIS